jgi:peptidoglycan/LPS O-acetylase OafA/YrhL
MRTDILTSYRFFAATLVVMFHFAKNTAFGTKFPVLVQSGPEMVTFFFVLSGFIMGVTCLDNPAFERKDYWLRRFSRIYPAYLIAALLMILLFGQRDLARDPVAITLHLLMLQAWWPQYALTVNIPGWSLSIEAFFYALLPGMVFMLRRTHATPKNFLLLTLTLWSITQLVHLYCLNSVAATSPAIRNWVLYFPLSHLCSFLLGLAGYRIATQQTVRKGSDLLLALLFVAVILVLAYKKELSAICGMELPFESSLLSPLFLVLILVSLRGETAIGRLFSTRPFLRLGEASYGIYILQKPVWMMYKTWLYPFANTTLHIHLANDIHFCIYLAILISTALWIQKQIEVPVKSWLRQHA